MRIGSSLLVDLSLDRPSAIDALRAQLSGGKVLTGRVLGELSPGRYQVTLGGQRLVFMPSQPLEVGSQFSARMIAGQLVLDFPDLLPAAPEGAASTGRVTVRTLPELLAQLGLPADSRWTGTIQALLQAGVTLSGEAVQLFQSHAAPSDSQDALLIAFLVQRGIPVDASLLEALRSLFRETQGLGQTLPELLAEGWALAHRLPPGEAAERLRQLLERLERQAGALDSSESRALSPEALRRAMADSGIFRESRWALALRSGSEPDLLADLKSILLELEQWAEQFREAGPRGSEDPLRLSALALASRQRIEQTQLASVRAPWDGRQVWFLEIPIRVDGQMEAFQMVIEGESPEQGKTLSPPVRVELYLDLSQLGPLRVSLLLTQRGVEGSLFSNRPEVVQLLQEHLPDWIERRREETGADKLFSKVDARLARHPEQLRPPALLQPGVPGQPWPRRVDLEA